MLSLKERIDLLEDDLKASPPRISVYHDLPFALLRYDPREEWELRDQVRLLATRLKAAGREVVIISLADLLWEAIERSEDDGLEGLVELEKDMGFEEAMAQANTYLSDDLFQPLPDLLAEKIRPLDPEKTIVFLTRAASMAPAIYRMSKLLEEMHGKTSVTIILFYPGTIDGTTGLRFMDMKDKEIHGNYRVKIYG